MLAALDLSQSLIPLERTHGMASRCSSGGETLNMRNEQLLHRRYQPVLLKQKFGNCSDLPKLGDSNSALSRRAGVDIIALTDPAKTLLS